MTKRLTTTAVVAIASVFALASHVSANSRGGGSAAPPPSGSGAPSGGARPGSGPHFYISPRYYSAASSYHPVVTYGNEGRILSYPPVHGATVPISPSNSHVLPRASGAPQNSLAPQKHQITNQSAQTAAQMGKWSHNNNVGKSRLDPQTAAQLRHWNGKVDSATEARRNHREFRSARHDRDWWRRRCAAIIFFDFGWWGWYDGWWYPAWGYDPYYSYYAYDQPIYGYDGLPPDQVIANVQSALQQRGYFSYAVDGTMGPLTRAAITNYQRDHMLPIIGDIDPATLGSLGLTD